MRAESQEYTVKSGDTLGNVAQQYGISLEALIAANKLANPDILNVGQILTIPVPDASGIGPSFKIIPDSELVYGPSSAQFDVNAFITAKDGYLIH